MKVPAVTIVGGGMITHDQLLPSLFQLQRLGVIGDISICSLHARSLRRLAESPSLARAFPGQRFLPIEAPGAPDAAHPELYREAIARLAPRNIVAAAVPDPLHFDVIMTALASDQHVLAVKPLVLTHAGAVAIEGAAAARGLLVAVDYHKRFDDRNFIARASYRQGCFGEFKLGSCRLMEKWYYRHSNFQNWCTTENSDAFSYVGCHYVDLVHFITGLLPVAVSVYGQRDRYPSGNYGFLWTDARIVWNNGACLNVQDTLGYPDAGPGSNSQGLTMYCTGGGKGGLLMHSDQYRGVSHCYVRHPSDSAAALYAEPNPDYFQFIDLGNGLVPVGYGYRSIDYIVRSIIRIDQEGEDLPEPHARARRQSAIKEINRTGIVATPANSSFNERVIEAGRESILHGGREVAIAYDMQEEESCRT